MVSNRLLAYTKSSARKVASLMFKRSFVWMVSGSISITNSSHSYNFNIINKMMIGVQKMLLGDGPRARTYAPIGPRNVGSANKQWLRGQVQVTNPSFLIFLFNKILYTDVN